MAIGFVKSVVHKAEDVGKSAIHHAGNAVNAVKDVDHAGVEKAGGVIHKASSAANNLFDAGKAGLSSVAHSAGDALHDAKDFGSKVLHKAEDVGSDALHKAGDFGSKVLHKAENVTSDVAHKLGDHGPLSGAADFVSKVATGHNFLSKAEQKEDNTTTKDVQAAVKNGKAENMGQLIENVKNINDDQTRIENISDVYGIQAKQMQEKLGVKDTAVWSGWANQAAGLVGDVHSGRQGHLCPLAQLVGANDELAKGNKKVFSDIAPVTDSFINNVDQFQKNGKFDKEKFGDWWEKQSQSMGKESAADPNFRQGFEDYAQAKYATSDKDKNAWTTAGTIRMAQHEQTMLQPEIRGAMHGGVVGKAFDVVGGVLDKLPEPVKIMTPTLKAAELAQKGFDAGAGQLATAYGIPAAPVDGKNTMDISKDVQAPNGFNYPSALHGSGSEAFSELNDAALTANYQLGETKGTGATDYSNLNQRMRVLAANMVAMSGTPIPIREGNPGQ